MKRLVIGSETLLVGDAAADAVVGYAVLLGRLHTSDAVTLNSFSEDGKHLVATVVLSQGVVVIASPTHSERSDPDSSGLLVHIRDETERLRSYASNVAWHSGDSDS